MYVTLYPALVFMCFYQLLSQYYKVAIYNYCPLSKTTLHGGSGGMASTVTLTPPQPFEWTRWKRSFKQFMGVSGLGQEDESRQISTLLYCMGDEAEGVLACTNIAENSLKDVMAGLDG